MPIQAINLIVESKCLPVEANNSIVESYNSSLSVEAEQKLVTTNVPDAKCKSNSPAKYYLPVVAINLTVESECLPVEANNSIVGSYNSSLSVEAEQKLAAIDEYLHYLQTCNCHS